MKYEMDLCVRQVRNFTILILAGTIFMTVLTLFMKQGFQPWHLAMYFLGCFGALVSGALIAIDRRLSAIENRLNNDDQT